MKNLLYFAFAMAIAGCSRAQTPQSTDPEWKATVKVVDETGQPVAGADVTIGYYVPPPPGESIAMDSKKGKTDINGMFASSARSRSVDLSFGAGKEGYYHSHLDYELGAPFEYNPVKWSPTVTLLLKRVINPIPMRAKSVNLGMPVFDKAAGFDLTIGDWATPYGKGVSSDIIFTAHREKRSEFDSDYKLVVTFPNQGDGIQEFVTSELDKGSALHSPHEAPMDAYRATSIQTSTRRPGKPIETSHNPNRNYFFRVQTILDENGKVKSALYGKIYGDFLRFTYYLNPTPNDRNVEFDPKQNLIKNLKNTEQVDAP